ncbi:MAG TPA: carbohydrate ABC transporter permease [Tepidisphaeraceae bacterium]|jgi:ABC-type glycerol-3-phosphate transport system permease component|nr:carbohydrate ABC transporter permease [Tepidisphaeraceae bacterium]
MNFPQWLNLLHRINPLQWFMISLAMFFLILLPISRRVAVGYARYTLLTVVGAIMLIPFAWLVCASFKDTSVLNEYSFLPPIKEISSATINLDSFRTLFTQRETVQGPVTFWRYIANSIFLASAGTMLSMFFSSMGGYALAKFKFRGRTPILTFMLASMTIPGIVLLAPNFEVIWRLGWLDSYKALLVPACVSVFGIFLYRQAMLMVPDDLIEAGRIDGCGEFRIYMNLVMPLVRPMTGAFCLITFLGTWNSFLAPNIYLQSQNKLPLPVVLNQYIGEYTQQYGVFLAGTLIAIIPPALLFLALQKEFISGLTSGAVKQ